MPRKPLLLGLMAVFTLGNLASVLAPTYDTLMVSRFVAGLPHGAFFGIAALVAAHLMGPQNRAKAVAHVMSGLTVATVLGVPIASCSARPSAGAALSGSSSPSARHLDRTLVLAARPPVDAVTSPLTELGALQAGAGLVGAAGRHGRLRRHVRRLHLRQHHVDRRRRPTARLVPLALMVFGLGMVVGNLFGGRMADVSVIRGALRVDRRAGRRAGAVRRRGHNPWTALLVCSSSARRARPSGRRCRPG